VDADVVEGELAVVRGRLTRGALVFAAAFVLELTLSLDGLAWMWLRATEGLSTGSRDNRGMAEDFGAGIEGGGLGEDAADGYEDWSMVVGREKICKGPYHSS
jgi:hypothetical protein